MKVKNVIEFETTIDGQKYFLEVKIYPDYGHIHSGSGEVKYLEKYDAIKDQWYPVDLKILDETIYQILVDRGIDRYNDSISDFPNDTDL